MLFERCLPRQAEVAEAECIVLCFEFRIPVFLGIVPLVQQGLRSNMFGTACYCYIVFCFMFAQKIKKALCLNNSINKFIINFKFSCAYNKNGTN